jgi:hypothetical protein
VDVGRALVSKGIALGQLDRSAEAITAYDGVVTRFGDATTSRYASASPRRCSARA